MGQGARALRASDLQEVGIDSPFSRIFLDELALVVRKIRKMAGSMESNGSCCTADELSNHFKDGSVIDTAWKGDQPNHIHSSNPPTSILQLLGDLHNQSDLVLAECVALSEDYKCKALRHKCSLSAKQWRSFCAQQLSGNVGARILHRYTNRNALAQPVPLFKPGSKAKTPNQAVEEDASHWKKYWQKDASEWQAHRVLDNLRRMCRTGLRNDSNSEHFFHPKFTPQKLQK